MAEVRNFMTFHLVTIEPSLSVVEAAKRMIEEKKGPLPVVEGRKLVGILTDRDIIARVVAEGRDPKELTVDEVATKEDLATVMPTLDVDTARQTMDAYEVDRVFVVENDDELVGVLSEADIRSDEGPLT